MIWIIKYQYKDHYSIFTVIKPKFILMVFKRRGLDHSAKLMFEISDVSMFGICRDTHDLRVTVNIVY